jgi:diguanylate cyclase (GGDEF)-like protein
MNGDFGSKLTSELEDLDLLDRSGKPPRARRRYVWASLAGVAIMAVLLATTQVVLAVADRKDALRQGQIAIAAAGQTEFALMHAPVGLIGGQVAGEGEYTLSAHLRSTLIGQMRQLMRFWHTSLAGQTYADAHRLTGQIVVLMNLIRQRRLRIAGGLYDLTITPLSDAFGAKLARAQTALNADTNGADNRAVGGAVGVAGIAGVLLVLLFFVSAAARGRMQRAEIEEGVLAALATTDSLTAVPNHRALTLSLRAEFERARRYHRPLAILFLDIDHFKRINDEHGHAAGDTALASFAGIVSSTLRSADSFGRWGGEEFLAVLPETDHDEALATAERVRDAVGHQSIASIGAGMLTCSIGVAVCPEHATDPNALIAVADRAMYAAKSLGRDRCEIAGATDNDLGAPASASRTS